MFDSLQFFKRVHHRIIGLGLPEIPGDAALDRLKQSKWCGHVTEKLYTITLCPPRGSTEYSPDLIVES